MYYFNSHCFWRRNGTGEWKKWNRRITKLIFANLCADNNWNQIWELFWTSCGLQTFICPSPLPSTSNTIENCLGVQHKILSSDISLRLDLIRFNIINIKLDLILLKICPSSIDGMPTVSFTNFIISDKNISMTNLWATKLLCIYKRSDY